MARPIEELGLARDLADHFKHFPGTFAYVFHRDALVIAVYALVLFNRCVDRRPALTDNAKLSIELAFGVAAEHLGGD